MSSSDFEAEYAAVTQRAGLHVGARALLQVAGSDRVAWLNNLVTNVIKTLEPGQGNYAFALNVKGRILFDLNMLVLPDAIWLDVDERWRATALAHLERFIIMEDVQLADRSDAFVRVDLIGPSAAEIVDALGWAGAAGASPLSSAPVTLVQKNRLAVRDDLGAVPRFDLWIERADLEACVARLLEIGRPVGLAQVGEAAVETLRIEQGVPASVQDLDEEVLPAETGQIARAVCYTKGCYLGQEVVERMRSRNVVAQKLVHLALPGPVDVPTALKKGDLSAGRITSACHSPAHGGWLGLGYVKALHTAPGTELASERGEVVRVVGL
jgi:folate-binding protein YgfZ